MDSKSVKWGVVIVAAGSGTRFGGQVPKQFTSIDGIRIVDRAIALFRDVAPVIVVVIPPDPSASEMWDPPEDVILVEGGRRRQDSVLNGLREASRNKITHVLVHDGARPLVPEDTIRKVMREASATGACIPAVPVYDTVKRTDDSGTITGTVNRSNLFLAQTPQGFSIDILTSALEAGVDVTDEASAVEAAGFPVKVVPGDKRNIKVTEKEDLEILNCLCTPQSRVTAAGLDFHPYCSERPLIVCGCRLSEEDGLYGHSDADVVLHAVSDALLSAARIGDIGTLFPPGDPAWKNADSSQLLRDCAKRVRCEGWSIESVDVTLIGEKPKVSPNRALFIGRLAEILDLPEKTIWIKGTTTNTLGDLGRGDGLGCLAIVQIAGAGR